MVNELNHIKLSFTGLPHFHAANPILQYEANQTDSAWMIFALESTPGRPTAWRCIQSSFNPEHMYGQFKVGAAWEVHTGQRLVKGRKVKVERYLANLQKLPMMRLSELVGLLPVCRKAVPLGAADQESYGGHFWDSSTWRTEVTASDTRYTFVLENRPNLIFMERVDGPYEVALEPTWNATSRPFANTTLDLEF